MLNFDQGIPVYFNLETIDSYSCHNYRIDQNWSRQGLQCSLTISGVNAPTDCDHYTYPATAGVYTDISEPGIYAFTVVNGDRKASGTLTVTDKFIAASYAANDVFSFRYDTMRKVPDSTLFGGIGYKTPNYEPIANSLIDSIILLGAQPFAGPTGYYGSFVVLPDRTIQPLKRTDWTIESLVFTYAGDTAKLRKLMDRYIDRYPADSLGIDMATPYKRFSNFE